jgi:ribose transport system permease protein
VLRVLHGAWSMAATSQTGEGLELDAIAAVVVGGTPLTGGQGSVELTVLGSLIMVMLNNGMNMIGVDPYLQNIVKGVVLVAAVFVTIDRRKSASLNRGRCHVNSPWWRTADSARIAG